MAIEACGGGTPDLGLFLGVSIFIGIFGVEDKLGGTTREKPSSSAGILPSSSAGCRATDKVLQLTCRSSACRLTLQLYMASSSGLWCHALLLIAAALSTKTRY